MGKDKAELRLLLCRDGSVVVTTKGTVSAFEKMLLTTIQQDCVLRGSLGRMMHKANTIEFEALLSTIDDTIADIKASNAVARLMNEVDNENLNKP